MVLTLRSTILDQVKAKDQAVVDHGLEAVLGQGIGPPQHLRPKSRVEGAEVEPARVGGADICETRTLVCPGLFGGFHR